MDVFDSMEPWRKAEQLAADADLREAVLPKCARCNPKDTYSRAEGARVAVERLFEKKRKDDKPKGEQAEGGR